MMQAWRKVFSECSVSCGAIFGSWWVWSLTEDAASYTCSILFWQEPVPFLQKTIGAYGLYGDIILMTGMMIIIIITTIPRTSCIACLIMVDHPPVSVWHLAAGRYSGHHHRLMMPTWPNHSSDLLNLSLGNETVMHDKVTDKVLKGSERWNQGGETQRLWEHIFKPCVLLYVCPATIQHWSVMMLPSSNLGHTSLPPSLLFESGARFGWWNASELNGSRGICLRSYTPGMFFDVLTTQGRSRPRSGSVS